MVIKSSPNVFQLLIQALFCGTLKNKLNVSLLGVFFCTICQQKINNYYFYESTPQPIPRFLPRAHTVCFSPSLPAGGSSELTLKPMSPFLQQRQASMRKTKVKRPEKETATTARDEGHDSSLSGAPSASKTPQDDRVKRGGDWTEISGQTAGSHRKLKTK